MFNVSVNDTVQLIDISINHLMEDYLWWALMDHVTLVTAVMIVALSEKKVQKLSLGLYFFKRYTFVSKGCILVP